MTRFSRPPSISTVAKIAIFAFISPWLWGFISPILAPYLPHALRPSSPEEYVEPNPAYECRPHSYTTELVSLDPLLIYIENFIRPFEITELLEAGESGFKPSTVLKNGLLMGTPDRTSSSAGLPRDNPTVDCILKRAQTFMGSMIDKEKDDIGPPQLVRYTAGQLFNRHHDWYETPQLARMGMRGRGRTWNRMASFFVILEDDCKGGETWFPYIDNTHSRRDDTKHLWRAHEDGGLAFRPIAGNALFWVNLHANGTGDDRTIHAGLTVTEGLKTAMNIWPRKFYE